MVERQDIDALLISALYGELTPSEETRLAAHLDSHPGDRTALADLTHARGLVRESRLFQVQLDPPQSISALLMKEATRCAPKPEVQEGWFARFVRSFAAHPAMAAAAMLVVVLGVATFVTKRGGDQFAESTAPASQSVIQEQEKSVNSPVAANHAAPTGGAMGSGSATVAAPGTLADDESKIGALESAKGDSFRVALDDGLAEGKDRGYADKPDKTGKLDEKLKVDQVVTKPSADPSSGAKLAKEQQALKQTQQQYASKKTPQQGIELRATEAAPKDFDEDSRKKGKALAAKSEAKPDSNAESKNELAFGNNNDVTVDGRLTTDASKPGTGAASGGAANGAPGTGTVRRVQDATPSAPSIPAPTTTVTATRPATQPRNASPPPPPAAPKASPEPRRDAPQKTPPPAKTVDRSATSRAAGPAEEKPADPQLAWARDQHTALIAQVRAGECKKAASIATAISNRAPAYYQQNVETDRAVKACIAYINSERERDAEQRSERARANQKRSVNEPAPAKAAPSKPAAADAATSTK